ncbi:MAG: polysaccharide deacetylase family protein [Acidimicrobiales bacterium]
MTRQHAISTHSVRRVAKRAAITIDGAVGSRAGLVVLAYHRVGGHTPSPVDLPRAIFRRQMAHLAASGDVVTLDEGLRRTNSGLEGELGVVLTFDDGTADFVDDALPILEEFELPATIYLATSFIDSGRPFPANGTPLTWAAVRECVSSGLVTIGAHTHTHSMLDRTDATTIDLELSVSDHRIAEETGVPPRHFAYPKAVAGSPYADRAVRKRYESAAVAGTRANRAGATDPWRLSRSPIQNSDGWDGFVRKRHGGMRTEDDLRRLANRLRYRGRMT